MRRFPCFRHLRSFVARVDVREHAHGRDRGVPFVSLEHAPDDQLIALYRAATIVAAPSLYEGFGLPVLEGMACGAPVLAARAGSLPEVGGDAARYVDEPDSVHAWRTALLALAGDAELRAELALRGPVHAARFSWDRCADETLEVVKSARA